MLLCEIPETDLTWNLKHPEVVATASRAELSGASALLMISPAPAASVWKFLMGNRLHTLIDRHVAGGKPLLVVGPAAGLFFSLVTSATNDAVVAGVTGASDETVVPSSSFVPFEHWPGEYAPGNRTRGAVRWVHEPDGADELGETLARQLSGSEIELRDGGAVASWSWPEGSHPGLKPPAAWVSEIEGRPAVGLVRNWALTAIPLWPVQVPLRGDLVATWMRSLTS